MLSRLDTPLGYINAVPGFSSRGSSSLDRKQNMHTHYTPIHCAELQEKELLDFNFPALHKEAATHFRFLLVACLRKISEYVRNKNKTSGDINHKALLRASI